MLAPTGALPTCLCTCCSLHLECLSFSLLLASPHSSSCLSGALQFSVWASPSHPSCPRSNPGICGDSSEILPNKQAKPSVGGGARLGHLLCARPCGLRALAVLYPLDPNDSSGGRSVQSHSIDEAPKAQRGPVTCPRPHSWRVGTPRPL